MASSINLLDLSTLLQGVEAAAEDKKQSAANLSAVSIDASKTALQSAQQLNQAALSRVTELDQMEAARERGIKLAESDNIFDVIQLAIDQSAQPSLYTREGRQNRRAELAQDLAFRGTIHDTTVNAQNSRIAVAKAEMDAATSKQTLLLEGLRTQTEAMQLASSNIAESEKLRSLSLLQFDQRQLETALGQASDPAQKIDLGGFQYSQTELKERRDNLLTREFLTSLPLDVTDPKVASARREIQSRTLATMNPEELLSVRNNRYQLPDGTQADPAMVDEMYTRASSAKIDQINATQRSSIAQQYQEYYLPQEAQKLDRIEKQTLPTSPLRQTIDKYRLQLATANQLLQQTNDPTQRHVILSEMIKQREQVDSAVRSEATRLAKGNKELAELHLARLSGAPIDPGLVMDTLSARLMKEQGTADILPTDQSVELQRLFKQRYDSKLQATISQGGLVDRDQLKKEATQEAIVALSNNVAKQTGASAILGQNRIAGNPLGSFNASDIQVMLDTADRVATQTVKEANGMSDDDWTAYMAGQLPAGFDAAKIDREYEKQQAKGIYLYLEGEQAGLGRAFVSWWANNGLEYMGRAAEAAQADSADPRDSFSGSLQESALHDMAQQLINNLVTGREEMTQEGGKRVADFVTFKGDPSIASAILLQQDSELSDADKSLVFKTLLEPAIKEAERRQLPFRETMGQLESVIASYKPTPEQGELNRVLRVIRRNRGNITHAASVMRSMGYRAVGNASGETQRLQLNNIGMDWYADIKWPDKDNRRITDPLALRIGAEVKEKSGFIGKLWADQLFSRE